MLQQTRVEAVIPYYHRFLAQFPSIGSLAAASEADVLTAWSGLGYYSRARNLHRAAKKIAAEGPPQTHAGVLDLPGAGPYTAAAISSIALDLPHAAVDGNVMRVISRLTNDASDLASTAARRKFAAEADALLDVRRPGDFNQAMMELGATVCLPRTPDCRICPVAKFCAARGAGTERELPVKLKKQAARDVPLDLLLIRSVDDDCIFLIRRSSSEKRLADFWELPERRHLPEATKPRRLGEFRHQIVNDRFRVRLWSALAKQADLPPGKWFAPPEWGSIPLTTITKKALVLAMR
jgi:A/G-specific adenine glycosylase